MLSSVVSLLINLRRDDLPLKWRSWIHLNSCVLTTFVKWKQAWYLFNDGSSVVGTADNVIRTRASRQVNKLRRGDRFPHLQASNYLYRRPLNTTLDLHLLHYSLPYHFPFSCSHCFSHHISPRVSLKPLNNARRLKGWKGFCDGSLASFWSSCILLVLKQWHRSQVNL